MAIDACPIWVRSRQVRARGRGCPIRAPRKRGCVWASGAQQKILVRCPCWMGEGIMGEVMGAGIRFFEMSISGAIHLNGNGEECSFESSPAI